MVTLGTPAVVGIRGEGFEVIGVQALITRMTYSQAHHSLTATRPSGVAVQSW